MKSPTLQILTFLFFSIAILIPGCAGTARFTSKDNIKNEKPAEDEVKTKSNEEENVNTENITSTADALEIVTGVASFYGKKFHGRQTANGEIYNMNDLTAAHETYPFNTVLKVTNLMNDKTVVVRINDRKPDFHGRIIDLSYGAAKELDMLIKGITQVKLEIISWGEN